MRNVVLSQFVTLDGVMEDPHKWIAGIHFKFWNDEMDRYASDLLMSSDALLLGRVTYEAFAEAWPSRTGDYADRMNSVPKHVVSSTLTDATWSNSSIIKSNVRDEVARLKQQPGDNILIFGSRQLVDTLTQHNLVDEYHIWIDPIVVGRGKRLFDDGIGAKVLKLADTTTFSSGVIVLKYVPATE